MHVTIQDLPLKAEHLLSFLKPGHPMCLYGPLGVGKTTLARALIQNMYPQEEFIPSPSFPIMIPYEKNLWHIDLYRLKAEEEILQLGLLDIMAVDCCIIEWPERLGDLLPSHRTDITLSFTDQEDVRHMEVSFFPQSFGERL